MDDNNEWGFSEGREPSAEEVEQDLALVRATANKRIVHRRAAIGAAGTAVIVALAVLVSTNIGGWGKNVAKPITPTELTALLDNKVFKISKIEFQGKSLDPKGKMIIVEDGEIFANVCGRASLFYFRINEDFVLRGDDHGGIREDVFCGDNGSELQKILSSLPTVSYTNGELRIEAKKLDAHGATKGSGLIVAKEILDPTPSTTSTTSLGCALNTQQFMFVESVEYRSGRVTLVGNEAHTVDCGGANDYHWADGEPLDFMLPKSATIKVLSFENGVKSKPISQDEFVGSYKEISTQGQVFEIKGGLLAAKEITQIYQP